jgi:large subunit ribosomal protein L4
MDLQIYTMAGKEAGRSIKVSDDVFAIEPHENAVYQAVQAQMTHSRQGTVATKTRTMVAGGGRKPWRQKGRGTARAGSTRSPVWRGGGTIHGPQPHDYTYRLPKKVKRLARRSVLSDKVRGETLKVVEDLNLENPKTRDVSELIKTFGLNGKKVLLLVPDYRPDVLTASRNIKGLTMQIATDVSIVDLMNNQTILITESAIKKLEGTLLS